MDNLGITVHQKQTMQALSGVNLNRLLVFVTVVEAGSLTAAARRLGLAKTMISTHLQRLEAEIGASLMIRTTRRQSLTEAGSSFYQASRQILRDAEDAISAAGTDSAKPRGTLRITATIDYMATVVAPVSVALRARFPELRIELTATDRVVDLLQEGFDVAIRSGRLADSSSLQATRVGGFAEWLVASPQFLAGAALPTSPREAAGHAFVALSALQQPLAWTFTAPGGRRRESVRFEAGLWANTAESVRSAVVAGGGLAVLPHYAVEADIEAGRLLRLLPDWKMPERGIYAVFPAARHRAQKTRAFIDALKRHVGQAT